MSQLIEVTVPDLGDFADVEVIEILVAVGDSIQAEDSLITVESDKASMEIPSSSSGVVKELKLALGDSISTGSLILMLDEAEASSAASDTVTQASDASAPIDTDTSDANEINTATTFTGDVDKKATLVVLGSGPGGYTAAFRAADLGVDVILIERYPNIGGVCLNVGCIPSKALLHTAQIINEAEESAKHGVSFGQPEIDIDKVRANKEGIIKRLTGGLGQLAKQRKVEVVHGYGKFTSANTLDVVADNGDKTVVGFDHCIIAAGSRVTKLPFIPWDDPRVMDSTDALE
jgi:dihydrolipoamide dehydrogenase